MKTRFLLQIVALLFAVTLIVTLTLAVMGKMAFSVFWLVAIIALVASYALHRKP